MYLEYYQLSQKPFQINTDPAFLWLGEKHKEALATFKYGLYENKNFLLLTGYTQNARKIDRTIVSECARELDLTNKLLSAQSPGNSGAPRPKSSSRLIYFLFPLLVILLVLLMSYFSDTLLSLLPLP